MMKITWLFCIILLNLMVTESTRLLSQENTKSEKPELQQKSQPAAKKKFIGFVDKNLDGINDKFIDANGDGKNDIDGKQYSHKFKYIDKNKDKINDLWIDRDGDGVNDLMHKFKNDKTLDFHHRVIDVDEDARNDVTGELYDRTQQASMGKEWGFWNESAGKLQGRFIDEDGNGIDDRLQDYNRFIKKKAGGRRMRDVFIDEDGDGICDDRLDFIGRMGKKGKRTHHGGQKEGGGHRH